MPASSQVVTLGELRQEFQRRGLLAHARARLAAEGWAKKLLDEVRKRAQGRPGPRVITGEYINSFFYDTVDEGALIKVEVGSTAPQMNRLEYGFYGIDSLGRHANSPPFPHWRPALAVMDALLEGEMAAVVDWDLPE